jgi:hypothetical protein
MKVKAPTKKTVSRPKAELADGALSFQGLCVWSGGSLVSGVW